VSHSEASINYVSELEEAGAFIAKKKLSADVMLILGSGLGSFADSLNERSAIPYSQIPHFPTSSAPGHKGQLVFGSVGKTKVACFQGRVHAYEGYPASKIAFGVRCLSLMGVKNLIVTNAAGGVNKSFSAGDLMLITNHLSFYADDPAAGLQHPKLGEYFYDTSYPYDREWGAKLKTKLSEQKITLKEGIYAMMRGPHYESAADISALRVLGADAVGMSTIPEVLAARQMQTKVLGISLISNMAAGILDRVLTTQEVFDAGEAAKSKFSAVLSAALTLD